MSDLSQLSVRNLIAQLANIEDARRDISKAAVPRTGSRDNTTLNDIDLQVLMAREVDITTELHGRPSGPDTAAQQARQGSLTTGHTAGTPMTAHPFGTLQPTQGA
jgi:hypothetical protein